VFVAGERARGKKITLQKKLKDQALPRKKYPTQVYLSMQVAQKEPSQSEREAS